MTFSGRFVLNLIHFAALQGAPAPELVALTGHSLADLRKEATRLSAEVYDAVLERILRETGDPFFGLHAAEQLNLATAGLIYQIVQTSPTVWEALENSSAYSQLGCRAVDLRLEALADGFRLCAIPDPHWVARSPRGAAQTVDGNLVFLLRVLDTLTHRKQRPRLLTFSRPRPADTSEYERIFGCPLRFGQAQTALHFAEHDLQQTVITSDYDLLRVLVQQAELRLEALHAQVGFGREVKRIIIGMMRPDFPTIEQVARNLNLSVRSLQRKLRQENTSFSRLTEELRQEMAMGYLRQADLSINEIAHLLNYADGSAFIRSFKRWTGETPQAHRTRADAGT